MQVPKNLPVIQTIIDKLEEQGFRFQVKHTRFDEPRSATFDTPCIGHTTMYITKPPTDLVASGITYCSADDQFCRSIGTRVAFHRALRSLSQHVGRKTMKHLLQ